MVASSFVIVLEADCIAGCMAGKPKFEIWNPISCMSLVFEVRNTEELKVIKLHMIFL